MDSRPVGVFDSGMGGLTVLHECLVTMPHEDFVYLGDTHDCRTDRVRWTRSAASRARSPATSRAAA